MMTRTRILLFMFALGGMAAALFLSATARADAEMDYRFTKILHAQGISSFNGDAGLIGAGHLVCSERAEGYSGYQVALNIMKATDLDAWHAGYLVGASESVYCPWAEGTGA